MILLGILLLGVAGAFTGLLIAYNQSGGPDTTVVLFGHDIATMNTQSVFLSGIALALAFCLGCALALGGGTRMRRRAAELREARAEARAQGRKATAAQDALRDQSDETPLLPPERGAPAPKQPRHRVRFGHRPV
ncbi:hypothetical protein QMK19_37290 [Streptomyces sp. H10-C2]|uniref:hypothetical protein n=1 Tax=unclassified Streptomyces TaxID=2593676 RepID=UPI0024B9BEDA|nr:MULTISPECIES: hypothetical protein [unclassified Streptomyces]MDJ0347316.1 hypothetical protein [Streptomyces sp. PH10-H1]MDJ0375113.1 hypothetical protein [Streptomyces sp. H10-C2]